MTKLLNYILKANACAQGHAWSRLCWKLSISANIFLIGHNCQSSGVFVEVSAKVKSCWHLPFNIWLSLTGLIAIFLSFIYFHWILDWLDWYSVVSLKSCLSESLGLKKVPKTRRQQQTSDMSWAWALEITFIFYQNQYNTHYQYHASMMISDEKQHAYGLFMMGLVAYVQSYYSSKQI